ncbi:hypothetical protein WJX84_012147 [Apatococcus fuscideae]|uniref:ribonuclease H n=1 Tax=Apatococcus fuscideae TaxID=2026836 RepID=A0AAW1T095_9CHLO
MPRKKGLKYYAVRAGRVPGIYMNWEECQKQVDGFSRPSFKAFFSQTEAEEFINSAQQTQQPTSARSLKAKSTARQHPAKAESAGPVRPDHASPVGTIDPSLMYRLEFDGGARDNARESRLAGCGALIAEQDSDAQVGKIALRLGSYTNNQAEYAGLVLGLEAAHCLGVRKICAFGDSNLVVNQVGGRWQVKEPGLKALHARAVAAFNCFETITLQHVLREFNKRADALANLAMDGKGWTGVVDAQGELLADFDTRSILKTADARPAPSRKASASPEPRAGKRQRTRRSPPAALAPGEPSRCYHSLPSLPMHTWTQDHVLSPAFMAQHADRWHAKRKSEQSGEHKASQGIVMAAGKAMRLGNAYVTLRVLRDHMHSNLPVEIWYLGTEEMDVATEAGLEAEFANLSCIDASSMLQPEHHGQPAPLSGYALKVYALYATRFEEVLLLDCDSMPIINPQDAFDSPEFRKHGSMLWPDLFGKGTERVPGVQPQLYTLFGLQPPWIGQEASFMWAESGQLLFDRVRHADVLEYLWFLNAHQDPVYQLAYGDKDTFLLAFMLADKREQYLQVEEWTRLCLHERPQDKSGKLEHVGIIHHDPAGSPAFLHRTSGGKMDLLSDAYFTVDFITQPLSPQRAYVLFEGAAEVGNYRYPRHRFGSLGTSRAARQTRSPPLEQESFQVCLMSHADAQHANCGDDGREDLPVPIIRSDRLGDRLGDPKLAAVLEASYKGFEELRGRLRQPNNDFMTGIAWLR